MLSHHTIVRVLHTHHSPKTLCTTTADRMKEATHTYHDKDFDTGPSPDISVIATCMESGKDMTRVNRERVD